MSVASPEGWRRNPQLVLDFYNARRRQVLQVQPNKAHYDLSALEKDHDVNILTQNVDDLHERAGSTNVIHLHGELLKARSVSDPDLTCHWTRDIQLGDSGLDGQQLRPHIVWFGESVPNMAVASRIVGQVDVVIIVGTSLQVYPAAALVGYAQTSAHIFYVDQAPEISSLSSFGTRLTTIQMKPQLRGGAML
ncbi:UNVERIFIED_CONTAM: hypothetical protein GTU68_064407 [Idotea baltica]|nr:hypothetical protein [Idotea baltica]